MTEWIKANENFVAEELGKLLSVKLDGKPEVTKAEVIDALKTGIDSDSKCQGWNDHLDELVKFAEELGYVFFTK